MGRFDSDVHLFGIDAWEEQPLFLLGADDLGRDLFSRIMFGARISLSIGLLGVGFSLLFGVVLGGISGYYGGLIDVIIQRIIELLRSLPTHSVVADPGGHPAPALERLAHLLRHHLNPVP